ncbi:MAG: cytochrome c [Oricola sp.]|jgi:cytochrome c556|nr:cytochrome c [Oricola sp.]
MRIAIKTILAGASMLALAACGGETGSSEQESKVLPGGGTVEEMVHMRHETMEEIGDNFKSISDQLKSGSPDLDAIQQSASFVAEKATQVGDWFPAETSPALGVDTDSLAAIWEQPEEFADAVARFETASADLDAAAQTGDVAAIGEAFKATGGSCKNCHETFREDD